MLCRTADQLVGGSKWNSCLACASQALLLRLELRIVAPSIKRVKTELVTDPGYA